MSFEDPTTLAASALEDADPRERLRAITALRVELDVLEVQAVRNAISAGCSWSQVAAALGISKQSAHRRHANRMDEPAPPPRRAAPAPS
jgi:FixJ family two-component response regulator